MKKLLATFVLLFTTLPAQAAVVLQYHHIGSDSPPITSTTIKAFEQHLDYLAISGLEIVPLEDIVNKPDLPADKRVAITFDDAYHNIYQHAVPRLKARGWPFTLFVATEYIDQKGYMTWDELRDVEDSGGTVANHTHDHPHLLRQLENESHKAWLTRIKKNIQKAESLLTQHLRHPVKYLAYPYGEYDTDIRNLISRLGYTGFGQQSGAIGPDSVDTMFPRFPLSGAYEDLETFKTKVHTLALPIRVPEYSPMITENPPTLTLAFSNPEHHTYKQLTCYGPGGKTALVELRPGHYEATNQTSLPIGRSRYNCTMPSNEPGRFYWYSQLWILKQADGSWYAEP